MADGYYRDWAEAYEANTQGVPGDIKFYADFAREADGLVVELGAGTGRIAIPCAQAGARVWGIDSEPSMLVIARRKAEEAGVTDRLTFIEGDMRDFDVPEPAALVTIPVRTFLHTLTTDDQMATLHACHRALRSGGRLELKVFNPNLTMVARWMGRGERHWVPSKGWDGYQTQHRYAPSEQVSTTHMRVRAQQGKWRNTSFTLRFVHRFEMEHLLQRTGFQVEMLYGGIDRSEFSESSPEMVWVARRD